MGEIARSVPAGIIDEIRALRLAIADAQSHKHETFTDAMNKSAKAEAYATRGIRTWGRNSGMRRHFEDQRRNAVRSQRERVDQARNDSRDTRADRGYELRIVEAIRDLWLASAQAMVHARYSQMKKAAASLKRAGVHKSMVDRARAGLTMVREARIGGLYQLAKPEYEMAVAEVNRQAPTSRPAQSTALSPPNVPIAASAPARSAAMPSRRTLAR
jgi:hypothetical protein